MSTYKNFEDSNVFNPLDIISQEETNSGNAVISLDLSSFVTKENPVFDKSIFISNPDNGINFQGITQKKPYSQAEIDKVTESKQKLTNISFDNVDKTIVTGQLDLLNANVEYSDESISQNKVSGLVSKLTEIDNNLSQIQNNDSDILNLQNEQTTQNTRLEAVETLSSANETSINNIEDDILNNVKVDIVNNNNLINTNITNIANNLSKIDLNKTNIQSNDAEILQLQTDVINNKSEFDAQKASVDTHLTNIDLNLVSHTDSINAIDTLNTTQSSSIAQNTIDILDNSNNITTLQNEQITQNSSISNLESEQITQNNSITSLQNEQVTQNNNLTTLNGLTASHSLDISNLQTQTNDNSSRLTANEASLLTKEPKITNINRLNANLISDGSVTNERYNTLNNIRTDISIQDQLDVMKTELDLFDGSHVNSNTSRIVTLENEMLTKEDIISDSNKIEKSNVTDLVSDLNTIATNQTNTDNSISTINTNLTALTNADSIHDTQITNLENQDVLLQSNIDLKNDIISLTNRLDTTLIHDSTLNENLDTILSTLDSNIDLLNNSKQNNITNLSKLNSALINRSDGNLQYIDISSSLQTQLNNISSMIAALQSVDSGNMTTFTDIENNFTSLETDITSINNSISTLQGLQDGDVVSFQNINNSITNLTNTKHNLIDNSNKLNSSLLNRDDNLQYIDISASLQNKLNSLDSDIGTKQNLIDNSNKLDATLLNLNNNLQYADYGSSIATKFGQIDSSISSLNATDVSQTTTNTSLQNQINTLNTSVLNNDTDITNLQSQITSNDTDITNLQSQITNNDTDITNLQNSKNDIIDINNKLNSSFLNRDDNLQYININSGLQEQLDALASSGGGETLKYSGAGVDIFEHLSFETNLPSGENEETEMSFTISGLDDHFNGNYKCIQSSYSGAFDFGQNPAVQTTATRGMTHLFTNDTIASGDSYYRSAFNNVWFKDTTEGLVQYTDWAYDPSTGNYVGNTSTNNTSYTVNHSTTATNSNTYSGEYLEFQFPFLYEISKVKMTSGTYTTFLPSETSLLGSGDDGVTWEFIDQLSYARNTVSVINHSVSTTKKYSRFRLIFQQLSNYQGVTIEHLEFEGDVYSSTSVNTTLNNFIISQTATNASVASDITTANTNIATNTTDITTANTNIATNATNIATNTTDIITANTNIALKLNITDYQPKIDDISSGVFSSNVLTYTFNEDTIYMNQLTVSNPFELDLTINSPQNNKTYKQKVIVDCLEFKGYINTLKINTETVEIKYLDGDGAINLAPIAGYSNILQTLEITRINDTWFCLSKMQLFFNSASNTAYFDPLEPPVITINDSATINHEINSGAYSDAGGTAIDAADLDLTNSIVVSGDTVNVAVLGVYQIHYDVTDARGNNAVRKTRVVNVIDTTNPVVTIVGDAEITIAPNSTYTEQGATATDNSGESLTVVISGDAVNTAVQGDYTVLYTATDSSGNSHQISRLVHVDGPVLEWSNPTVDIFEGLIDMFNLCPYLTGTTIANFTKSGDVTNPFLNGDYTVIDCWHHSNSASYDTRNIFRNASTWSEQDYNASNAYTCQTFGSVVPPFNQRSYPSGFGAYQGHLDSNSLNVFYTVTATNSQTYNGLHHTFKFPFSIEVSKVDVVFMSGGLNYALLGSNDDGTTWDFILENTTNDSSSPNVAITVSTTAKYNMLRLIYTGCEWLGNNINLKQVKLYGDIYSV